MPNQQNFLSRIGGWFRRPGDEHPSSDATGDITTEVMSAAAAVDHGSVDEPGSPTDDSHSHRSLSRSTFLRPWAKRDAAIENLQNGVEALGSLMNSIRDNMERTSVRQDELLEYLSHLPQALQQIPEQNRMQGETLKAIQRRMDQQTDEQSKLNEILEKINEADALHGRALEGLEDRVKSLDAHDGKISENLSEVGQALESVSKSTESTTMVLSQMRESFTHRDGEIERMIARQGTRFTVMMVVAIVLSVAALASVAGIGWLLLHPMK